MQSVFLATQRKRCFANKQYDTTTWPPAVSTVRPVTDDMLTSAACFRLNETLNDSDSPPAGWISVYITEYLLHEIMFFMKSDGNSVISLSGRLTKTNNHVFDHYFNDYWLYRCYRSEYLHFKMSEVYNLNWMTGLFLQQLHVITADSPESWSGTFWPQSQRTDQWVSQTGLTWVNLD